jgi:hypothetical protein
MSDILKVLMMGGQRVGKTSMLAGLIETITNGNVKELIEVQNISSLDCTTQKLNQSITSLKHHLIQSYGKTFLIDENKTSAFDDYKLLFRIPGTDNQMEILFTDANGEFYDMGRLHDADIREKVKNYDVFLIAIDTPFLMEAANPNNILCTESINKSYNHVNDIYTFMTEIDDKDGADAKLVVFVPLKCEKWIKENRVDEVKQRVMDVYEPTIHALSKYSNIEIDIIPVQTVGNIVFKEQCKPILCVKNGLSYKCAVVNNKQDVRFADGKVERVDLQQQRFIEDTDAVIREGSTLTRPNSWFTTIGKEYAPHNCDQLAYYILQFYLAKVLFAKNVEDINSKKRKWKLGKWIVVLASTIAFGLIGAVIAYYTSNYLAKKLGTISLKQMQDLINKLKNQGYIKKNTDGIETIKESKLYIFDN